MAREIDFTAQTISKLLDVSLARVGQLAKEGVITKLPNGRYPADAIPQYIRWIRESSKKKNTNFTVLIEQEKYRKMKRDNDIDEKLVAPVSLLTDALLKAANQIVPILESLPLIMKRNWPEITGDQITLVKKAIAECRNAVADMEVDIDY